MAKYFIFIAALFVLLTANPFTVQAGTKQTTGHTTSQHSDDAGKTSGNGHLPLGAKSHHPVEKAHSHVPSWDELAHIHHFHKNRMKKVRRHYSKCVFFSKMLLVICHAAILFVSYLHVIH